MRDEKEMKRIFILCEHAKGQIKLAFMLHSG